MNNRDYTISVLEDYSRLDEVYRLTHDTLAESGNIKQTIDGKIATCPHLDEIPETTILIAEYQGKIIGIGKHKDLIEKNPMYSKLIKMQNLFYPMEKILPNV